MNEPGYPSELIPLSSSKRERLSGSDRAYLFKLIAACALVDATCILLAAKLLA